MSPRAIFTILTDTHGKREIKFLFSDFKIPEFTLSLLLLLLITTPQLSTTILLFKQGVLPSPSVAQQEQTEKEELREK